MLRSTCRSSEESGVSTASSLSLVKPLSKPPKRHASMKFATPNLSLPRSTASEENLQSFLRSHGVGVKKTPPSSLRRSHVPSQSVQSTDGPAPTPSSPDVERGRERIRRYTSAGTPKGRWKSPASPDRFIPVREFNDTPSTPFHVSKSPRQLSPEEKLLRRRSPKADPFMPSHPQRALGLPRISNDRRHSPHYAPHMVNDSAVVGNHALDEPSDLLRHISPGTVWNVGGAAAVLDRPPLGIPDGTGGLLGSGTTAPMYTAKFLPQTTTAEEREKHESRVALALDIDPATRLLGTSKLWPLLESRPSPSSPEYERLSPFVWKDSAWKKAERDFCKSIVYLRHILLPKGGEVPMLYIIIYAPTYYAAPITLVYIYA